ncbi:LLM class flavin-dependent oxidoreductase [Microbacterium sp. W1N]|uniref:LLM class flavin-dependent oxidoreductase n=1 Tax=Microbacterium festucae TaxID=2977531 RepID=UPI0021BF4187|nr:LLM class flavin-dependent oxidoreductase [Microbacterium festucae]MCT9820782.1 LLM class flavin-dependent oxidoreductase [Microbacterium festucae]
MPITDTTTLISEAGFTLAGTYPEDDPRAGLEETLGLFEYAEELGFQLAGIRQRHLERGVSSALTFLAAATQRTSVIRLETAVVPLGYETPFRLAEDFATVDALSGGRISAGISTSAPHGALLRPLGRTDGAADVDAYTLIERFLDALEGRPLAGEPIATPYGPQTPRVQPHVPSLRERVWLGGGSQRSVRWAAERGLKLLLGNLASSAGGDVFEPAQRAHIDEYYDAFAGTAPAVGVERVIVPTDSATAAQRAHYADYAAAREARTHVPTGGLVFQRDLVGTSDEIVRRLRDDPAIDGRTELRIALPYAFAQAEYRQILSDIRHAVLPQLGWRPAGQTAPVAA